MTSTTNNNKIEGASIFDNVGDLVDAMDREEEVVEEEDDEGMFVSVCKNNITARTRKEYHDAKKRLVIWLYHKAPETLNEEVATTINLVDKSDFVNEKAKNMAMKPFPLLL